jgi:hypothetical protein
MDPFLLTNVCLIDAPQRQDPQNIRKPHRKREI